MKQPVLFGLFAPLAIAAGLWSAQTTPEHPQVQKVYLFAMTNGFDQYLASRLTAAHVFEVVTDPAAADLVLTDRIGEAFQTRLDDLYPKEPPEQAAADSQKEEADEKDKETDQARQTAASSFRRARGTVFLVNPKTRAVMWSTYDRPKNSSADELDRTAGRIANRLKHDLTKK